MPSPANGEVPVVPSEEVASLRAEVSSLRASLAAATAALDAEKAVRIGGARGIE